MCVPIGTIGLIKGINSFDMNKGTRLATYVSRCIENEILMDMRANKKIQNELSLQEPIGTDKEGNEVRILDIVGTESDEVIEQVDLKFQIKDMYEKMKIFLKAQEKQVLELRYGLINGIEKTQREIAKMLGISRSYVSRIEKKALKKLKDEIKE